MSSELRLGIAGFGLIAVCYGFARFAFGLFLPRIADDLLLSASLVGTVSGGAFLGYCLAILLSARLSERIGARPVSVAAALVAAAGMAGIAAAPSALWLAGAVILAGSSTGLASPPLAAAVAAAVDPDRQAAANTAINAGTSAGVALSGPVALLLGGEWRSAFAGFAVAALALALCCLLWVPATPPTKARAAKHAGGGLPRPSGDLARLVAAALLTGAASTGVWSFGGELAALRLGWSSQGVGLLWIAVGCAGVAGAWAGSLVARHGLNAVHRLSVCALAAGLLAVGSGLGEPVLTLAGGALFGAAYVMLTGVYLVWGVAALPDRPATGLTVAFLTLAIGQTAGAPLFGWLLETGSAELAVPVFAGLAVTAGLPGRRPRSTSPDPAVRRPPSPAGCGCPPGPAGAPPAGPR